MEEEQKKPTSDLYNGIKAVSDHAYSLRKAFDDGEDLEDEVMMLGETFDKLREMVVDPDKQ